LNVTTTVTLAPALDAPTTMTKLVADDMVQEATAVPPTVVPFRQSPPCSGVTKLEPVTVMLLLT
jgi:hypothetical protein